MVAPTDRRRAGLLGRGTSRDPGRAARRAEARTSGNAQADRNIARDIFGSRRQAGSRRPQCLRANAAGVGADARLTRRALRWFSPTLDTPRAVPQIAFRDHVARATILADEFHFVTARLILISSA